MSFRDPVMLLTLLAIPLAALAWRLAQQRRRRFAVRLPTAGMAAALLPRESALRRLLPLLLLALGTASAAVALARPTVATQVPVQRASVMLVTDASGSMAAEDVAPTRLSAVQSAIARFLEGAPEQLRVGLLSYSSSVEAVQVPTTNHAAVRAASDALQPGGGTATGDALAAALQQLRPQGAQAGQPPAAILLLSDGMVSDGVNPIEVAQRARELGVRISTVALGTPQGTVQIQPGAPPLQVPPDPQTLRAIAQASGGQAFDVQDASSLGEVYEQLGRELGTRPAPARSAPTPRFSALLLLAGGAMSVAARPRLAVA